MAREFTLEEVARGDGKEGRPVYNLLILVLALRVMGLGYLGGQMVFPTKAR